MINKNGTPAIETAWGAALDLLEEARMTEKHHAIAKRITHLTWAIEVSGLATQAAPVMRDMRKRLNEMIAHRVVQKALPLSPATATLAIKKAITTQQLQLAATVWVTYVTASRIDDVLNLAPTAFILEKDYMGINFRCTKANKRAAPREDHCQAIHRKHIPMWLELGIRQWQPPTKNVIRAYLKKLPALRKPPMADKVTYRRHYTLHSLKQGALEHLATATANGTVPPQVLSLAAKHKRSQPIVESTTVGYVANVIAIARTIQLHKATATIAKAISQKVIQIPGIAPGIWTWENDSWVFQPASRYRKKSATH